MADIFGDRALFAEFERDRSPETTFISYNTDDLGSEDRSKIVFTLGEDDSDALSEENEDAVAKQVDQNEIETTNLCLNSNTKNNLPSQKECNTSEADSGNEQNSPFLDEEVGDNVAEEQTRKTAFQLQHELRKFRKFSRLIDSTRHVPDEQSPAVQIIFQNNHFSRKYRAHIEDFIMSLIANDYPDRMHELSLKADTLTTVDLNDQLTSQHRTMEMWKRHCMRSAVVCSETGKPKIIGCAQFHDYFSVDTLGWPLVEFNPNLTESWNIPVYQQIFTYALPMDEEEIAEFEKKKKKPEVQKLKSSCWNCDGEHLMTECPLPKDYAKIKQNRMNFMAKSSPSGPNQKGGSRYHGDMQEDPRFSKFKPGQVSDELREALGIGSRDLPFHIYKMREHGYPPGWLAEAQERGSGIVMFDKHGKETNLDGDTMEDGEIDQDSKEPSLKIDKIIEYPGFTVLAGDDVNDECRRFNLPRIQEHQLKDVLKTRIAAKRKREEDEEEQQKKKSRLAPKEFDTDMDLDDDDDNEGAATPSFKASFRPPLPVDTPPCLPPPPKGTPPSTPRSLSSSPPLPEDSPFRPPLPDGTPPPTPDLSLEGKKLNSVERQSSSGRDSPSLEELEKQYSIIQQELLEPDTQDSSYVIIDSCEESDSQSTPSRLTPTVVEGKMSRQGSVSSIKSFGELGQGVDISAQNSPTDSTRNFLSFKPAKSLSKDYGTPIINKHEDLPSFEKFGEGIEDHLLFENLPDSVGTYSKMQSLISKIREKVSLRKKKKKSGK